MSKIIRVFPRVTSATPCDILAIHNRTPGMFDEADEVHISVAWTYDLPRAEWLAEQWSHIAPVTIGGPATGMAGGDFVPGQYIKHGYVITSRGCNNRCWFCSVWKREGNTHELPITEGWNLLDDNILACSDDHIKSVFAMMGRQDRKPEFTGGLEAKRLKEWHVVEMKKIKAKQLFFAYDTPDDFDPLVEAGKLLIAGGFTTASHSLRCYVLCGYPNDTFTKAEKRMEETIIAGFMPMAMLWRDERGNRSNDWMMWQRTWARPAIINQHMKAQ